MKKYIWSIFIIFLLSCRAGNTGGCDVDCNNKWWQCTTIAISISYDSMTKITDRQKADALIMACAYMNNQCHKSCEKKGEN